MDVVLIQYSIRCHLIFISHVKTAAGVGEHYENMAIAIYL
jgi:hypothetical protein